MPHKPEKPAWHEPDHPSHSTELDGVRAPMAFAPHSATAHLRIDRMKFDVEKLERGVLSGNRTLLARAITLIESVKPEHRAQADDLLRRLYPRSGKSLRIGITGVPGVGKSTFIEALGTRLCSGSSPRRLAVLTIDPSSEINGGSILGDKTRMEKLSIHPNAFIRPSPSRGVLGGVARWTREAMIVCEAAGFDTIFVETVGVGQSEAIVRGMVDCFLLLTLAGAGDELQGFKKGIMELSDLIAITKADGDNIEKAHAAQAQLQQVVHYIQKATPDWEPRVFAVSALPNFEDNHLGDLSSGILEFEKSVRASGFFDVRRQEQKSAWLRSLLRDSFMAALDNHPDNAAWLAAAKDQLPTTIAREIIKKLCPWVR